MQEKSVRYKVFWLIIKLVYWEKFHIINKSSVYIQKLIKCFSYVYCFLRFQSSSPLASDKRTNYNRTNRRWQLVSLWQLQLAGERAYIAGEAFCLRTQYTHTTKVSKPTQSLTESTLHQLFESWRKQRALIFPMLLGSAPCLLSNQITHRAKQCLRWKKKLVQRHLKL